ncbi:hypothetical protein K4A83_09590 [Spirulina subsalsa FACHB-351]|uniref:SGNH/GDSL hydrolase family protein n=1 Tax=Spirulina subsalsa FACHB-351 TaxID=234711 RepID=A0ABT3L4U3_9CYAN|nr:hypothetical protein [Spirulina subsalsa]MCW6036516.1 hypothetical protein [Spirulina subsalsa FACHB-351]
MLKKFWLRCSLFFLIQAVPLLMIGSLALKDGYGSPGLELEYLRKQSAQYPSPRIILMGDSSVTFGLSAQEVHVNLKRRTLNLGYYANTGADFTVSDAKWNARRGDTVILSWSAGFYRTTQAKLPGYFALTFLLRYPEAFLLDPWQYSKQLLDHGQQGLGMMLVYGINRSIQGKKAVSPVVEGEEVMAVGSRIVNGDMVLDCGRESFDLTGFPAAYGEVWTQHHEAHIILIKKGIDSLKLQGMGVYYLFPPVSESAWAGSEAIAQQIEQRLRDTHHPYILGSPQDFVYPDDWFYDTENHLNCEGREARTRQLIDLLKQIEV